MASSYVRDDEMRLRSELWLRHGHHGAALYGDDGEMQCHECPLDFKRDSVDRIVDVLHYADVARMVKADQDSGQQVLCAVTGYIKLRHSHEVRFHFGKHRISHAHLVDPESWVHDHDAPMITGVVGATFRALRHMEIEAETAAADSVVKGN